MKTYSQININCNSLEILNLIKTPGNLEKFHPFCKKNIVCNWGNQDSVDYVHYYSGKTYKREFIEWKDNGYVLEIFDNRKLAKITWLVNSVSNGSMVKIFAEPLLPFGYKYINFLIFHIYVKHILKSYLKSVLKGLKYYSETKIIVTKDQFGSHIWYS